MSFGINGPDNLPSIQKSHHTNDGGAGNLGYFQQGRRQKDEQEKEEQDVFEFSNKDEKDDDTSDFSLKKLEAINQKIKDFWTNFQHKSNDEEEQQKTEEE